jgi:hypothetical protein
MHIKNYKLTDVQQQRLKNGVRAALSIPLIDSLEDFIWEGVFCYAKEVDFVDPLQGKRSKRLFDIVDRKNKIGWSAKALQWNIKIDGEFELVIQRADVFKKRAALGFPKLTLNSDPNEIGKALLKHWQDKVKGDAAIQHVADKRGCFLLKNATNNRFAYFEEELVMYKPNELRWRWTDSTKTGLQGIRKSDDFCVYRWYPNQKQFFERFKFEANNFIFEIEPKRIGLNEIIDFLNEKI